MVGIGASAGGLEAFTLLLNHLPTDTGMAFVLVQHLDPRQKSLLSEILARTTSMPVWEAQEGMTVSPNQVYVIPSDTVMTLRQNTLHLEPRGLGTKMVKTVDLFFNSLAQEWGNKSIGVVLSGGDTDGAQGLEAIKAAGGITFAQSELSAQVTGMPHTAIATGQVDFVLPPEGIAAELAKISRHPYVTQPTDRLENAIVGQDGDALSTIFALLRTVFGLDFAQYKHTTLQRRILRRMALYRLEKLEDYIQYLEKQPEEIEALYEELLIHVTSFFRDTDAFELLKAQVFPAILRDRPADVPVRIWVAGCSSGEEAYSIAIALLEFLADQPHQPQIQIFATDVSEPIIKKARLGVYIASQLDGITPDRLQRFFHAIGNGYQINKNVRELCVFARQNLLNDPPFSHIDLISCRNVLIYFGSALQKKVLSMFHYSLKPNGFLLLGSSETVGNYVNLFHLLDRKNKVYTKQLPGLVLPIELGSPHPAPDRMPEYRDGKAKSPEAELSAAVDKIIISRFAPQGVVINAQLDIVQFRGQMGPFLEPSPGHASLNLLDMVKEELRLELHTAIYQVKQSGEPLHKDGVTVYSLDQSRSISLDIVPITLSNGTNNCFLIVFTEILVFTEIPGSLRPNLDGQNFTGAPHEKSRLDQAEILRLQQELKTTKAHLQSIIGQQQATNQDLRAANEEILSSNEELQSTNEELQTAKEEIQATNEELSTINEELFRRNADTIKVSNDFQNLLSSMNVPILMLEQNLHIRRFTPTAVSLFNLIPADIGRPFSDIKHNLQISDLEEQILEVMATLSPTFQEVQDNNGLWYELRIRPYRTLDNRIDGTVVLLMEIDQLKRRTQQLQEARDYIEAMIQTVHDSLLVLNSEFQVITANQQFYERFQVSPRDSEQGTVFDLSQGQWNIPAFHTLLEDLLSSDTEINDFRIDHEFDHLGPKTMMINVRKIPALSGNPLILVAIDDNR